MIGDETANAIAVPQDDASLHVELTAASTPLPGFASKVMGHVGFGFAA